MEQLQSLGQAHLNNSYTVLHAVETGWALLKEVCINHHGRLPDPSVAAKLSSISTGGTITSVGRPITPPVLTTSTTDGMLIGLAAPTTAPALNQASTGGTITASVYSVWYTYVDADGGESMVSPEASINVATGTTNTITVNAGTLPAGVSRIRVYVQKHEASPDQGAKYLGESTVGSGTKVITSHPGSMSIPSVVDNLVSNFTGTTAGGGTLVGGTTYYIKASWTDSFGNESPATSTTFTVTLGPAHNAISFDTGAYTNRMVRIYLSDANVNNNLRYHSDFPTSTIGNKILNPRQWADSKLAPVSNTDYPTSATSGVIYVAYSYVDTLGSETDLSGNSIATVTGTTASIAVSTTLPGGTKRIKVYCARPSAEEQLKGLAFRQYKFTGSSADNSGAFVITATNGTLPPPTVNQSGRVYVTYTHVDEQGRESLPSPPADVRAPDGTTTGSVLVEVTLPPGVFKANIYVRYNGGIARFVVSTAATGTASTQTVVVATIPSVGNVEPTANNTGSDGNIDVWLFVVKPNERPHGGNSLLGPLTLSKGKQYHEEYRTIVPTGASIVAVATAPGCSITLSGVTVS